jgi:hypothetical protein
MPILAATEREVVVIDVALDRVPSTRPGTTLGRGSRPARSYQRSTAAAPGATAFLVDRGTPTNSPVVISPCSAGSFVSNSTT